jgi:hypothetical protein
MRLRDRNSFYGHHNWTSGRTGRLGLELHTYQEFNFNSPECELPASGDIIVDVKSKNVLVRFARTL